MTLDKERLLGEELKRLQSFIEMKIYATYGDGVADINIKKLMIFNKQNKIATVTAVHLQQDLAIEIDRVW